jgi:hypothetical protein
MRLLTLACLVACGPAPQPAQPPGPAPRIVREVHPRTDRANLRGRVVRDGKPVSYFGVAVSRNFAMPCCDHPLAVADQDGRFTIADLEPGTWDIMIVGPGFGRRLIAGRELRAGETVDLGEITVDRGHTMTGHVRDANGSPVARAKVTITSSARLTDEDQLTAIVRGNFTTTTDDRGGFRFDGLNLWSLTGSPARLEAIVERRAASNQQLVPNADATIDLVVLPTGGIDGVVEVPTDGHVYARPMSSRDLGPFVPVTDGKFRVDNLLPGTYQLELTSVDGVASLPSVRTTVVAQQRAQVTIAGPTNPITIHINPANPCKRVELRRRVRPRWEPAVARQTCKPTGADIIGVEPGDYEVCDDVDCRPITVNPVPDRQTFTLDRTRF